MTNLLNICVDNEWNLHFEVSVPLVLVVILITAVLLGLWFYVLKRGGSNIEISEAELGIGKQKIKLRPNNLDTQIAYKLWVELSTRKIGLPINLDNDTIVGLYRSWYDFFGITRELLKEIPVSKLRSRKTTSEFVSLTVRILNDGLRPHLTVWQARYHHWHDRAIQDPKYADKTPQELQQKFPQWDELKSDLLKVNVHLVYYTLLLKEMVFGQQSRGRAAPFSPRRPKTSGSQGS
jgi:hypothetical protein